MDTRLKKIIERLNKLAATIESPLEAIFKTCGFGNGIADSLLPHLPSGFSRGGANLVIVGLVGLLLTMIGAFLGFLQITIRIISLSIASRNSVVAIESGSSDTKPLLVYFVLMIWFLELDRLPISFILNSIPLYGVAQRLFLLVCSVPESGVAMLVYDGLLRHACHVNQRKTPEVADSVKQKRLSLLIKSATAIPAGEVYCSVRVLFVDHEATDELTYRTLVSRNGQWHNTLDIPFPEPQLTQCVVKIELLSKESIGSDKVVAETKFDLKIDDASRRQMFELSLLSPSGANSGELSVDVSF